jgi:hypothetical protein
MAYTSSLLDNYILSPRREVVETARTNLKRILADDLIASYFINQDDFLRRRVINIKSHINSVTLNLQNLNPSFIMKPVSIENLSNDNFFKFVNFLFSGLIISSNMINETIDLANILGLETKESIKNSLKWSSLGLLLFPNENLNEVLESPLSLAQIIIASSKTLSEIFNI